MNKNSSEKTCSENKSIKIRRIHSFDGIRAFAALLVFFMHVQYFSAKWNDPIFQDSFVSKIFFNIGHYAVDAFFIISAYLMSMLWMRKPDYISFVKARLVRIIPAYYVNISFVALIVFLSGILHPVTLLKEWLIHIAFLSGIFNPSGFTINPVYWSLSVEMALYVTIPLWVIMARKLGIKGFIIFSAIISITWRYWASSLDMNPWLQHAFPGQLFEISLGIAMTMKNISFPKYYTFSAIIILLYIAGMISQNVSPIVYIAISLSMLVIIMALMNNQCFKSISMSRPVVFMSDISYSFYLWHCIILYGLTIFIKNPILLIITGLILSFFIAWLSREFIEKKFH